MREVRIRNAPGLLLVNDIGDRLLWLLVSGGQVLEGFDHGRHGGRETAGSFSPNSKVSSQASETYCNKDRIPAKPGAKRNVLEGQVRDEFGYGRGFVASVQGYHVEEGEGIAGSRIGIRVQGLMVKSAGGVTEDGPTE